MMGFNKKVTGFVLVIVALTCAFGGYRLVVSSKYPTNKAPAHSSKSSEGHANRKVAAQPEKHFPASELELASETLWKMDEHGFCLPAKTSVGDESPNSVMRIWGLCKSEMIPRKNIKVLHLDCSQSRNRIDFYYAQNREECDAVVKGFFKSGALTAKR